MDLMIQRIRRWTAAALALIPVATMAQEPEAVRFEGLRTLSEQQARESLKRQLDYIRDLGVSAAKADDAAHFLTVAMRRKGYENASVDWELRVGVIILRVTESSLVMLGEVIVEGSEAVDNDVLEAMLKEPTRSRSNEGMGKSLPYVAGEVDEGLANARALYSNLGYFDAKLQLNVERQGNTANLSLVVVEGPLYRIATIDPGDYPEELEEPINKLKEEFVKGAYTPASASVLQGRFLELYGNAGYTQARVILVDPNPPSSGASLREIPVDLKLHVDRGERLILRNVKVTGNERIRENFFVRRFESLRGKPFDSGRANTIVRRMLRSGAFSSVDLREFPDAASGALDLEIHVDESPAREFGVYGGMGSWEGFIVGGTFQNYNLFGVVRRLDTALELTSRGVTGNLNVYEPWALGEKTNLSAGLFGRHRDNDGYTLFDVGTHLELNYELTDNATLTLFTQGQFAHILNHSVVDEALGPSRYFVNSGGLAFTYDRRDSPVLPTNGFIFHVSGDTASSFMGSEIDFLRSTARFSYYKPLGKIQLQAGARAGAIFPAENTDQLPIDLRFFSGGATTVRGFPERELGPKDPLGNPIGGEFFSTFNVEAAVPVYNGLKLAVFSDAGNLLADHGDAGFDDMRYSAGLGIRYDLPVGPIRLDYGWKLDPREGESKGAFHFGIGISF